MTGPGQRDHATSEPEQADEVAERAVATSPLASRTLALQHSVGNRAVSQMVLQRKAGWFDKVKKAVGSKYLVTVEGEDVVVANEAEEKESERIIKAIPATYGVEVSSIKSLKAHQTRQKAAPKEFLDKLKLRPWLAMELRAIEKALKYFAPILGASRQTSSRKDVDQEIVSVGKMEQKFRISEGEYKWRPDVMGEYYSEPELKAFTMYKHGETATILFGSVEKELEATATHEIAHGIFGKSTGAWVAEFKYWLDEDQPSGAADVEAPPTDYGKTNAAEDLAESVMLYFVDRERLKKGDGAAAGTPGNPCPKRCAFVAKLVGEWTPAPEKGDFPLPKKDPEVAIA